LPIFGYHEIEEKTLIPSLQTKSRANSRLYDWGPWEPRPLPRTPSKIWPYPPISVSGFCPNSWTSFSHDWLPKFVLNVRKRARFALNVPDRCRRRLLAQRIRGWWTPIVDDREQKRSRFSVPNASIGECCICLFSSSAYLIPFNRFHEGKRKVIEFSSKFGWTVVGWEKKTDRSGKKRSGVRREQRRLSFLFSLSQRNSLLRSLSSQRIFVRQAAAPSSSVQQLQAPDTLLGLCLTLWYA